MQPARSAARPLLRPRGKLAPVQPAGAGAGRGRERPAARAGPVPGHLREQPGRVLHGPGGGPDAPDGHRPAGGEHDQRAAAGAGPGEHPGHGPRAQPAARRVLQRPRSCPRWPSEGIEILRWKELSAGRAGELQQLFRERIYPVLTPLVVDPAHPFPYISGLSLSLAVMIAEPRDRRDHVRPGEGAAAAAPVPHRGPVPVRAAGRRDRRAPAPSCSSAWTSWSTTCSG